MQQVSPNVYVQTGWRGCNVSFVTTSDGVVMIDTPQRPSDAIKWRAEVQAKGSVRYLINTEHHGDHITGNYFFPTTVVSQEGTKEIFLAALGPIEQLKERVKTLDPEGVALMEGYEPRPPSITYSDRMTLYVGNHTFKLIHLPGHTPNETVVYVPEEKVVFTGDNVVYRTHPYLHQAVPFQWLESLKTIDSLGASVIVPGHGEVCDKAGIQEMDALLKEILETVRKAISSGMSKEEVAEKISFIDRFPVDPAMAPMMRQVQRNNVTRVYEELQKQR